MSAEKEEQEFGEESLPSDYADALRKDKKESEEELKELSGDYKADYDQYLKEKDKPKEEDDEKEELIRDYRSGLDLGNKESAPSAPQRKVIKEEPIETEEKEEIEPKQEVVKEEEAIPKEIKEEKEGETEKKSTEQEKESDQEDINSLMRLLGSKKAEKGDEKKDDSVEKEVEKLTTELFGLFEKKNKLLSKKNAQQGLMYRLGIKKKDSQINEEYRTVYDEYDKVLGKIAELTKYSKKEIEEQHFGKREGGESQERTPETERKAEGLKDYLYKKAKEVNEQIKNLEGGKKGSFEKIKALMKDRKFQFVVGLAIVGVAIAAPPTGFVSMITFGMHAGFLPAAYATKATALAGLAGGGFIMRGLSGFADDLKGRGREEIDLTDEIK